HVPCGRRRRRMHARGPADDRQRTAAARLRLVVGAEAGPGLALLGHRLGMSGREDAVLQGKAADAHRRETVAELVSHERYSKRCWVRSAIAAGHVQCHSLSNESLQCLLVDLLALVEIDRTPGAALEAGIEEA